MADHEAKWNAEVAAVASGERDAHDAFFAGWHLESESGKKLGVCDSSMSFVVLWLFGNDNRRKEYLAICMWSSFYCVWEFKSNARTSAFLGCHVGEHSCVPFDCVKVILSSRSYPFLYD